MSQKTRRLAARLPRGLADRGPAEIATTRDMLETIRQVYERYGFEAVETPAIEYTDALGKFLPDQDRPNEGVFSFQDDDAQWLSLRYDLTAPLARYVAENFDRLPKPYRSYRAGWVFRNEKPGPGRFRQFMQFDADTVGAASVAADAEICMMAADTLEALGIRRGDYVIKVNNRKVLDGVMEAIGLGGPEHAGRRLTVLRAIDKLDRLGVEGVRQLLGPGRKDESGDFTKGAGLGEGEVRDIEQFLKTADRDQLQSAVRALLNASSLSEEEVRKLFASEQVAPRALQERAGLTQDQVKELLETVFIMPAFDQPAYRRRELWPDDVRLKVDYVHASFDLYIDNYATISRLRQRFPNSRKYQEGVDELENIAELAEASRYGSGRIRIDPSVVRGLEYYTGPVYEAELTFEVKDDDGRPVRFGSVGGGGRYDGLVARFRGEQVPATGFSIGVSRLAAALTLLGKVEAADAPGPVVVVPRTAALVPHCMRLAQRLREDATLRAVPGFAAEMYLGTGSFKGGLRYADKRNCAVAIMIGESEAEAGKALVKDLIEGARQAEAIATNAEYRAQRLAQFEASEAELADKVREVLLRHR